MISPTTSTLETTVSTSSQLVRQPARDGRQAGFALRDCTYEQSHVPQSDIKTKAQWTVSDLTNAKPVSSRSSCIEFQDNAGTWHYFELLKTPDRIVFGGACNAGFLESGFILREEYESPDETLQAMFADLETYYNDGPDFVSRIVCNERM